MKHLTKSFLYFILLIIVPLACKTGQKSHDLTLSKANKVAFLNQKEAGIAITTDQTNGFFDMVNPVEISIQTKTPLAQLPVERKAMVQFYRNYLNNDVVGWTEEERKKVTPILIDVFGTCEKKVPGLFPKEIKLVKTLAKHYGPSVYYTRENCIIVPVNVLDDWDADDFKRTMFHETWHIISRYRPELQTKLYSLIGFSPVSLQKMQMPDRLRQHLIFNPDGVDMGWQMTLTDKEGKSKTAIPLLHTTKDEYKKGAESIFGYISFNLFETKGNQVITRSDSLHSTLILEQEPTFFSQIRDNTDYIIHPDEVIADNFTFLMTRETDPERWEKFSPEGKSLLRMIEIALKQYK